MLKRIRIKGYKSLGDVEATLEPLTVLFGPNASGKSNFLDALQLLSRMATSRTLKEAFDPPYRGKPLESFSFGGAGLKGLVEQDHLHFSIEADLLLSDAVVKSVEREIRDMRQPSGDRSSEAANGRAKVRERHLRYRIVVEMLPKSGVLRVADEYLAALTRKGEPSRSRKPFLERHDDKLRLRLERQAHPRYCWRWPGSASRLPWSDWKNRRTAVHPRRIESVAKMFHTREHLGQSQHIVTTHSPLLVELLPSESLFAVRREQGRTRIDPLKTWGPLAHREYVDDVFSDENAGPSLAERIMRGDFDA